MPIWAQIMIDLTKRIEAGEYPEQLPTDGELAAIYGVSRHTVREAVRRLHEQGVVSRARGLNTAVRPAVIEQELGFAYSFFRSVEEQGHDQHSVVLSGTELPNVEIAGVLELPATTAFVFLERVRLVDGEPVALDRVWLPAELGRPLLDVDLTHTSVYAELKRASDIVPETGSERIHPVRASKGDCQMLGVDPVEPLLLVERTTTFKGAPLEHRRTLFRGDRFVYTTKWDGSVKASKTEVDIRFAS